VSLRSLVSQGRQSKDGIGHGQEPRIGVGFRSQPHIAVAHDFHRHSRRGACAGKKTLQAEGFKDATTVADFLQNPPKFDLHKAVVICDEAGLQSNRQGEALLRLAQQNAMRVIFVGDVRQHVSVEAGDFLRVLETHSKLSRC
jgi:hypothetical protein